MPGLFDKVWIRKFDCDPEPVPEWFPPGLQYARPVLGYGVIDPIEMRIHKSRMLLLSTGHDSTLVEYLRESFTPKGESYVRSLVEELCYGVLRIHEGQGRVHGALTPLNICANEDSRLLLWAVPTARLELSFGRTEKFWEEPFRSPTVRSGETPTPADDIYSLGAHFMRLLCGNHSNFVTWLADPKETLGTSTEGVEIANRCLSDDPERRYPSAKALALALNSNSRISNLDIAAAKVDKRLGLEAFEQGQFEKALEHWQDARRKDWLDQATHNNIAVALSARCKWAEALKALEKARKLGANHPLVDTNLGLCYLRLGSPSPGYYWLLRALSLNPGFFQASRVLAAQSFLSQNQERALHWSTTSLRSAPKNRIARVLAGNILEKSGAVSEADSHRNFAHTLPKHHPLRDHLITEETPVPWTLYLDGQDDGLLRRMEIVEAGARVRQPLQFLDRHASCEGVFRALGRVLEVEDLP